MVKIINFIGYSILTAVGALLVVAAANTLLTTHNLAQHAGYHGKPKDICIRMITKEKIFPLFVIVACIGAGIVYLITGDIRRCLIWLAYAVANTCVTF